MQDSCNFTISCGESASFAALMSPSFHKCAPQPRHLRLIPSAAFVPISLNRIIHDSVIYLLRAGQY
jgi:hypothetical protein